MTADRLRVLLGALVRGAARPAARRLWAAGRRPLVRDRSGAVWIYVAVSAATMLGMVGLALDLGRFETLNTQAQDAADAAALAAASQLNGASDAITRATNAATTTLLVQNQQPISSTRGTVTMLNPPTFYSALNSATAGPTATDGSIGTVTLDGTQARFVQVTTQQLRHDNIFIPAIGASANATTAATAVAGNEKVICKIPPLFICNPDEPPGNTNPLYPFNINNWKGKEVLLKYQKTGGQWTPGNFSLLQVAITSDTKLSFCLNGGNAPSDPKCIEQALAAIDPGTGCVQANVNVRTGQVTSVVGPGLNTRFDMWQDTKTVPMNDPSRNYDPAPDVTKGEVPNVKNNQVDCGNFSPPPGAAMAIPRDTCLNTGTCNTVNPTRFGDGVWNCSGQNSYWSINHPGTLAPPGCGSPATWSRWDMYKYEVDNNLIPNNSNLPTPGEDGLVPGNPKCSTQVDNAPGPQDAKGADRRIIYFAIVNCQAEAGILNGGAQGGGGGGGTPIPVTAFAGGFLTEPVADPGVGPGGATIYMEFENVASQNNGLLHDIVQLYR